MRAAQIGLSVTESLLLVAALAAYLLVAARRLREIGAALRRLGVRVEALDGAAARSAVARLNWQLEQLVAQLPETGPGERPGRRIPPALGDGA